ncbi:MAG: hypothetical protein KME45_05055 [Stenomitos rutilans HA7619-LM2]|jgi:hypothetical protein|nr:hypothetical protein [Stenomitos rutilans HA7619-LM2]
MSLRSCFQLPCFQLFQLLVGSAAIVPLWAASAIAQVQINSTGVISGTITPPNKNPNFNQGTTRVDTDSQGRYFRNGVLVFDASAINPNLVRMGANGSFFVDFRGIPVVSTNGTLDSAILSGQLQPTQRFNNDTPVNFWGNIQDEFVVQGNYVGTVTDPATGQQYQGTFAIRGQGPRYSDSNGGSSPTVFDFRSQYNFQANPSIAPKPTVFSYPVNAMPVKLTITVPAGLQPIGSGTTGSGTTIGGTGSTGSTGSTGGAGNNTDPVLSIFSAGSSFEVQRAVLDAAQAPDAIGPKSRVLLR